MYTRVFSSFLTSPLASPFSPLSFSSLPSRSTHSHASLLVVSLFSFLLFFPSSLLSLHVPQASLLFPSIIFYSLLFYSLLFYSLLFYSILFSSILFYSLLLSSILFYSLLFSSILLPS